MRIFNYILFVLLMIVLMSGRSFGENPEEDEDDWENTDPAGGAGNVDDIEGGTPNVPLY